jgi:peptide/nickel transport system substrate-binding protein
MGMVEDPHYGPMWMLYEPLLDMGGSRDGTYDLGDPAQVALLGHRIDDAIQCNATHVWFNLARPYEPFPQILCQTCGSVLNQMFSVEHGCWSGDWGDYTGWIGYNNPTVSMLDSPTPVMCGTGPYKLETLDYTGMYWSIVKFDDYWGGWSSPDHVPRAVVRTVSDWATRKAMFLSGDADIVDVPRINAPELLNATTGEPLEGIRCYKDLPLLSVDAFFFTFDTTPESSGQFGKINDYGVLSGDGIPRDFFSDVHVRKAFASCINFTMILHDQFLDEAYQPNTFAPWGIPYVNPDQPTYGPQPDFDKAKAEFDVAFGENLKNVGFTVQLVYNTENTVRRAICESLAAMINTIGHAYYGDRFHASTMVVDWSTYIHAMYAHELPTFFSGWLADYADMDDFVFPFMHSSGIYAYLQRYSNATVDALIEAARTEFNWSRRQTIYNELQRIYYDDGVSLPIYSIYSRFWFWDWVRGWYYNKLCPGLRLYKLFKLADPPAPQYSFVKWGIEKLSQHQRTEWGDNWCVPTSAAMSLSWFAEEKGYRDLLPDYNHDGKIDKEDKWELANILGSSSYMNTDPNVDGTTNYHEIDGVMDFIRNQMLKDAGKFEIKWYGEKFGFNGLKWVPVNNGHVSFQNYKEELAKGEDVLVGVYSADGKQGHCIVGRAFNEAKNPDGTHNVGFVDPWGARDIDTTMNEDGSFKYDGEDWYVGDMLSISPVKKDPPGAELHGFAFVIGNNTYVINATYFEEVYVINGTVYGVPEGTVYNTTGTVLALANGTIFIENGTYFPVTGTEYIVNGTYSKTPAFDHDVAVTNITPYKTVVGAGYSTLINVTVADEGLNTETFNVTAYANTTDIATFTNITSTSGSSTTITFTWNTTGFAKGNYTLSAYAWPVPGETNTADNNFTGGMIIVAMVGDITGPDGFPDGDCDIRDVSAVARLFGVSSPSPEYNPNFDINDDGDIDIKDVSTVARHFGEHYP